MTAVLAAALFAVTIVVMVLMGARAFGAAADRYRARFTRQARLGLADLFLFVEPERLFFLNVVAIGGAFLIVLLVSGRVVPALVAALLVGVSPSFLYRILKRRRVQRIVQQLPDALVSLAASLKAGASLLQALEATVQEESPPIAQELDLLLRELRVGVPFEQALNGLAERVPSQDLALVIAGMKISREIGGNLSEVLDRLAHTIRRKLEMEGKIAALTAQGKLQGLVMTGLPVFLAVVLYHMEPVHMARLFTEWFGWVVIGVVVVAEGIGYFFIRKIVNIDV